MPDVRCSAAAAPLHIRQAGSPAAGDPWARALPRPSRSQGKISSSLVGQHTETCLIGQSLCNLSCYWLDTSVCG